MTPETSIQVRMKALRDAAAAVCTNCKNGHKPKRIATTWIHHYTAIVHHCAAASIHDLIKQAEAEEREAGDAAAPDLLAACNDLVERKYNIPAYATTDREGDFMCPTCYASIFSSGVTHEADCPIGRIESWIAAAKGEKSE